MTATQTYSVFGRTLLSEVPFPELDPCATSETPDWTFTLGPASVAHEPGELIAEESIGEGASVRLERVVGGLRFIYSDTGVFVVSDGGRSIRWHPADGADDRLMRQDLLGRVLAAAAQMGDAMVLHASGALVEGDVVGLMGERGSGKSTLAAALTRAGALHAADDALFVWPGPPPLCAPGIHQVRLRPDAARRMTDGDSVEAAGTPRVTVIPEAARRMAEPARLSALYLLIPVGPSEGVTIRRERLEPVHAAVSLLGHSKLGALQGMPEAAAFLDRARLLVESVPVYSLVYPRDLDRVDECVAQLLSWHG